MATRLFEQVVSDDSADRSTLLVKFNLEVFALQPGETSLK